MLSGLEIFHARPFFTFSGVVSQRAEQVGAVLQGIEVPSIRRIMAHNYLEHVTALVSSPGAVPSALQRCFGANVDSLLKKRVME